MRYLTWLHAYIEDFSPKDLEILEIVSIFAGMKRK